MNTHQVGEGAVTLTTEVNHRLTWNGKTIPVIVDPSLTGDAIHVAALDVLEQALHSNGNGKVLDAEEEEAPAPATRRYRRADVPTLSALMNDVRRRTAKPEVGQQDPRGLQLNEKQLTLVHDAIQRDDERLTQRQLNVLKRRYPLIGAPMTTIAIAKELKLGSSVNVSIATREAFAKLGLHVAKRGR